MTEMTHEQVRDLLPDVINATADDARRKEVEDHLRSCAGCASEMRVLQMVKDAPSFAPMIDAVKVSSRILPYGGIPAERERPKTRVWTMLAAVAAVAVIAVTAISRGTQTPVVPRASAPQVATTAPAVAAPAAIETKRADSPATAAVAQPVKSPELQVAVGLDDLSEGNIKQLASELEGFDGLPSAEPENIDISGSNAEAGGRP